MAYNLNIKPVPGTINFLGSSFSGADIRLLVHSRHTDILKRRREAEAAQILAEIQDLVEQRDNAEENLKMVSALWKQNSHYVVEWQTKVDSLNRSIVALKSQREAIAKTKWKDSDGLVELATVSSISIEAFRGKKMVRALGHIGPKSFTHGLRTVAGSIVFAQFDEHALAELLERPPTTWVHEVTNKPVINPDQLPPMTITAQFANEYGSISELTVFGIEFISDSLVLSIEDIYTENTCTYVARDYNVLLKRGDFDLANNGGSPGLIVPKSASALIRELKSDKDYQGLEKSLGVFRRDPYR